MSTRPAKTRRVGTDPADARVTVIALHGRDQTADFMVEHIVSPLARTDIAWLLPQAAAGSWYPDRADTGSPANTAATDLALDQLAQLEAQLEQTSRQLVILGFSQGACLACEYVARAGRPYGALVALTGSLMGSAPARFDVQPGLAQMPVLLAAGDADPWISSERLEATARAFERAGADVTIHITKDADHRIRVTEVAAVGELLDAC